MARGNTREYEDETVTEVKVDVDISELDRAIEKHAADREPLTMEAPTTQRKVAMRASAQARSPTSLPADTEPETLDPTYVVSVPGEGLPGVPAPGAEGEPDTLKPPLTMGVRQIANSKNGPASVTKPGIGRVEAQAMDSILEETTSTSSRSAWLESARKMLLPDPDEDTQSARMPAVNRSEIVSSSQPLPSPKPGRSPAAASVPMLNPPEDVQTEKRIRKNVTMVGIAPPANPVEVKIPPSPPAPAVSATTDTRRAGPELAVYVPPAHRDEKSFLPKLGDNEGEVTDLMPAAEKTEKTDVNAPPPAKAALPLPTPPKKDDQPFETKREPLVELPPPAKPLEVKSDSPLETKREPAIDAKPATVKLEEAKKASDKLPRPPTTPMAIPPASIGNKTMVSAAISPSKPPEPYGLSPSAAPQPKKDAIQKTLASSTAASLLMGATPVVKVPAPIAPSPVKGGTARPPPPPPIEEPERKPQTVVMKAPLPPINPPPAATSADSPQAVAPKPGESSAKAVPAAAASTPALPEPAAVRGPSKSKIVLSPFDAMRRSPQLLAAVIATSVLLLVSGIGVGYIIRGSDPASTTTVDKGGEQASTSPSTSAVATNDPPPKATQAPTPAPEPTTPATVALADPLDEPSPSGVAKNTGGTKTKPQPQPHPHPTVAPIIKPKPRPKPVPTTPTTAAPPPAPTPTPAPTPKGFDPNSI